MAIKTAIGLMSGTSMDGIDVALVRTDGEEHVERGPNAFYPYSPDVILQINAALDDAKHCENREQRLGSMTAVEDLITRLHADVVEAFLEEVKLSKKDVDLIGFHGQTVLHRPDLGFTIQLGDGERLASETGIDCVYDMRAEDMLNGGQGAPLVPIYHLALKSSLSSDFANKNISFVNIGGISNITYIGKELIAFDCGPGNALIDQWVQKHAGIPYDQGGMIAAEGQLQNSLAREFLSHKFFELSIPKSLDRNDFTPPSHDAGSVEDVARTLAYVTAASILRSCEHLPQKPDVWIICGGGRHNPHIMKDLKALAEPQAMQVMTSEDVNLNGDAMEAECWAYLSVRCTMGLPITYPKTTGVLFPVSGGKFAQGRG